MNVLYVGHASGESLGYFLVKALRQLGVNLLVMDTNAVAPPYEGYIKRISAIGRVHRLSPVLLRVGRGALSVLRRLSRPFVLRSVHNDLWRNACEFRPDLVFVVRGHWLEPNILEDIKRKAGSKVMFYHSEDFLHPAYYSVQFLKAIPLYDCIFTVIRSSVSEYEKFQAQRVEYLPFGYDPDFHRPVALTEPERRRYTSDVTFLGKWSPSRQELLEALAKVYRVAVWGYMWERVGPGSVLQGCVRGPMSLTDIAKVTAASKVMLNPLNNQGRMEHVMRTFEIPACGGFQLARRTDEHLALFEEGREIACFDSMEELHDKIGHYLRHESEREKVARAGHERVLKDGHSYLDRMRRVVQIYREIR